MSHKYMATLRAMSKRLLANRTVAFFLFAACALCTPALPGNATGLLVCYYLNGFRDNVILSSIGQVTFLYIIQESITCPFSQALRRLSLPCAHMASTLFSV